MTAILQRLRGAGLLRAAAVPTLVFGLHIVCSRTGTYLAVPVIDVPMHFLGGVAIAYFVGACLRALPADAVAARIRPAACAAGIVAFTCTAALLWEFAEFISDRYFGTHAQLDLEDTLLDMALGSGGGVLYALWTWSSGALGRARARDGQRDGAASSTSTRSR